MNKYFKTPLKFAAIILGTGCFTLAIPTNNTISCCPYVLEASTRLDTPEQDTPKQDAGWEFDAEKKTLKIKNTFSSHQYDDFFSFTDTWKKFDGVAPWASYSNEIEKVIIEDGIKELPIALLSNLPNLIEVKLPVTITELPSYLFYNCTSLEKVEIPNSVTTIGYEAFFNCSSLKNITISKGIHAISTNVFEGCHSLENIKVSPDNLYFTIKDDILYDKKMKTLILAPVQATFSVTIPETVETIGAHAFANCKNLKQIHIPYNVKEILGGAFYNCTNLKSVSFAKNSKCVKIADSVMHYGDEYIYETDGDAYVSESDEFYGAFENCRSLTTILFPDSLKTIGGYSLNNCTSLKSIHFGSSFESVTDFYNNYPVPYIYYQGLTNFTTVTVSSKNKTYSSSDGILFNKSKTKLVWYPQNKKDKTYKIPTKVKEIGTRAFKENRNLIKLNLSSVEKIYKSAFYKCNKLETIQWSKKLKLIDDSSFYSCKKLKSYTSYGNHLKISYTAFSHCTSLKSVTLKNGTYYIGMLAFFNCPIKKVTIPNSVKKINEYAFGYVKDNDSRKKAENFTIYCKKYSTAYYYAKKNKLVYKYY